MQPAKGGWSYIVASDFEGTLYVGVTSNLIQRSYEHRTGMLEGFTKTYGCKLLVWHQWHDTIEAAISHEKKLKKLNREQKMDLIRASNPHWDDLYPTLKL